MQIKARPLAPRRIVFMEEVQDQKHVVLLEGDKRSYLTEGDQWHLYPDINEAGDQVTLVSGPSDQNLGVSVVNIDTGEERVVSTREGRNLHPSFSGDGSKIAFSESTGEDSRQITIVDNPLHQARPGFEPPSEPDRIAVPGSEGGYFPSLSEDGELVLYQRSSEGKREIVSYDFETAQETVVAEGMAPSLSPDETEFAYTQKIDGQWNIRVKDLQTGAERQITNTPHLDFAPSFAPDGSIYFASDRGGSFDIYHLSPEAVDNGGEARLVAAGPETLYAPEASA